jgi:hypothetical protein
MGVPRAGAPGLAPVLGRVSLSYYAHTDAALRLPALPVDGLPVCDLSALPSPPWRSYPPPTSLRAALLRTRPRVPRAPSLFLLHQGRLPLRRRHHRHPAIASLSVHAHCRHLRAPAAPKRAPTPPALTATYLPYDALSCL